MGCDGLRKLRLRRTPLLPAVVPQQVSTALRCAICNAVKMIASLSCIFLGIKLAAAANGLRRFTETPPPSDAIAACCCAAASVDGVALRHLQRGKNDRLTVLHLFGRQAGSSGQWVATVYGNSASVGRHCCLLLCRSKCRRRCAAPFATR